MRRPDPRVVRRLQIVAAEIEGAASSRSFTDYPHWRFSGDDLARLLEQHGLYVLELPSHRQGSR